MNPTAYTNCALLLKTIGHPLRLAILESLKDGEKCVSDVCEIVNTPQPNVSQHLSVLRSVGLVNVVEKGNMRSYSIAHHEMIGGILDVLTEYCLKRRRATMFEQDEST